MESQKDIQWVSENREKLNLILMDLLPIDEVEEETFFDIVGKNGGTGHEVLIFTWLKEHGVSLNKISLKPKPSEQGDIELTPSPPAQGSFHWTPKELEAINEVLIECLPLENPASEFLNLLKKHQLEKRGSDVYIWLQNKGIEIGKVDFPEVKLPDENPSKKPESLVVSNHLEKPEFQSQKELNRKKTRVGTGSEPNPDPTKIPPWGITSDLPSPHLPVASPQTYPEGYGVFYFLGFILLGIIFYSFSPGAKIQQIATTQFEKTWPLNIHYSIESGPPIPPYYFFRLTDYEKEWFRTGETIEIETPQGNFFGKILELLNRNEEEFLFKVGIPKGKEGFTEGIIRRKKTGVPVYSIPDSFLYYDPETSQLECREEGGKPIKPVLLTQEKGFITAYFLENTDITQLKKNPKKR